MAKKISKTDRIKIAAIKEILEQYSAINARKYILNISPLQSTSVIVINKDAKADLSSLYNSQLSPSKTDQQLLEIVDTAIEYLRPTSRKNIIYRYRERWSLEDFVTRYEYCYVSSASAAIDRALLELSKFLVNKQYSWGWSVDEIKLVQPHSSKKSKKIKTTVEQLRLNL